MAFQGPPPPMDPADHPGSYGPIEAPPGGYPQSPMPPMPQSTKGKMKAKFPMKKK